MNGRIALLCASCLWTAVTATSNEPATAKRASIAPSSPSAQMADWAKRHGDTELADAVEYNLAHVQLLHVDKSTRDAAEKTLARIGDDFTLAWLDGKLGSDAPKLAPEIVSRLKQSISQRIASPTSVPTAPRVWLLRGAISDVTCNALETSLKKWCLDRVAQRASDPEVRKELSALAKTRIDPKKHEGFATLALDRRAAYARQMLPSLNTK